MKRWDLASSASSSLDGSSLVSRPAFRQNSSELAYRGLQRICVRTNLNIRQWDIPAENRALGRLSLAQQVAEGGVLGKGWKIDLSPVGTTGVSTQTLKGSHLPGYSHFGIALQRLPSFGRLQKRGSELLQFVRAYAFDLR